MSWLLGFGSIVIFKVCYEVDSVFFMLFYVDVYWKVYCCINIFGNFEVFYYLNFLGWRGLCDNLNFMFWRLKVFFLLIF